MMPRLMILALLLAAPAPAPDAPAGRPEGPKPDLTPEQVVRAQLDALKHNDDPREDAGIAAAFAFASPENRKTTGPLERFAKMVKGPQYRTMIGHTSAEYGPMMVTADKLAAQSVKVVGAGGETVEYMFILSKDAKTGCWMTDGVAVLPPPSVKKRRQEA